MIRAVIFDVGGVLLRTMDKAPRTALAEKYGLTYEEMDEAVFGSESAKQAGVGAISEEEHWQSVARRFRLTSEEMPAFRANFWGGDRLDRVLLDFIRSLRPGVKTAVLSNAWSNAREVVIGQYEMTDAFDVIIFSAEARLAKPDPEIFRLVLKELGSRPEEAVFVDDVPENVAAARALGMHGIVFKNPEQVMREIRGLIQ